jgi:hypothetical protein
MAVFTLFKYQQITLSHKVRLKGKKSRFNHNTSIEMIFIGELEVRDLEGDRLGDTISRIRAN